MKKDAEQKFNKMKDAVQPIGILHSQQLLKIWILHYR